MTPEGKSFQQRCIQDIQRNTLSTHTKSQFILQNTANNTNQVQALCSILKDQAELADFSAEATQLIKQETNNVLEEVQKSGNSKFKYIAGGIATTGGGAIVAIGSTIGGAFIAASGAIVAILGVGMITYGVCTHHKPNYTINSATIESGIKREQWKETSL